MTDAEPISTYTCCECGRAMAVLVGEAPIDIVGICLPCAARPGWHHDPAARTLPGTPTAPRAGGPA